MNDSDDVKMRPQLVWFYNCTKRGVDTIDKMCGQYTTARISKQSLAVFHVQHHLTIDETFVEIKRQILEVFSVDAPDREKEYSPG